MEAFHQPALPTLPTPTDLSNSGASQSWDNSALYSALNGIGASTSPPSSADWYLDTGASTHMAANSGITSSPCPLPLP